MIKEKEVILQMNIIKKIAMKLITEKASRVALLRKGDEQKEKKL